MAGIIRRAKINTVSFDYFSDGSIKPASCQRIAQSIGEAWGVGDGFYVRDLMKTGRVLMMADTVCEFGTSKKGFESCVNGEYWASDPEGRFIKYNGYFTDSEGEFVFGIINYFMVVDLKEKRALYPKDLGTPLREGVDRCPIKDPSFKIDADMPLEFFEKRIVRRGETDALGHVNNSYYAEYALDTFSDEDIRRGFGRMVIRYSAQLRRGDEITIMKGSDEKRIYIKGMNSLGKTGFEAYFERR
ncbi:MAG: hypothetical protein IJG50_05565 [Clostridia bacterium]|nr:hypothetical protein [Clostridia bacterium]